jgi:hypothetical protein
MNFVRLLPVIFSALIMSAHFSRAYQDELAIVCLLLPFLLFIRKQWVARLFQVLLVIGSLVWVKTAWTLVQIRQAQGVSWIRLLIILGIVALFTGLSALVFQTKALKERYHC